MNVIFTVIKKELTDTLRDKRTLISAIIVPALIIPLLLFGVTKLQKILMDKEETKALKIAFIDAPESIRSEFEEDSFMLLEDVDLETGKTDIQNDELDAVLEFDSDFMSKIDGMGSANLNLYYKSTNLLLYNRISDKIGLLKSQILDDRIQKLNISAEALTPIVISKQDIASQKEQIGKTVGGFLPYIFIIFCFLGCMYPAIDLITGEKERGTIETLLTSPASRFKILVGKMITISIVGLSAAFMTILGMMVGLKFLPDIPLDFLDSINDILSTKFIVMLFGMLFPLSIFFAGLLSAIVIRAKSFKEAQSIVTPLNFVVIIPAMVALMPSVELNWQTVWVPILNIALATKEIIAGSIQVSQYAVIVLSLTLMAFAMCYFSFRQFSRDDMVLK
ncbi:ABC transporter permease [Psychroflexus tropicus]|uniref:ABC transporter permease n=1 Tax=Psychroflexus tropicus TaxID=197345 RepID=UPI000360748F|nr:ABC transporter permease [Psychroflexus tropicus]